MKRKWLLPALGMVVVLVGVLFIVKALFFSQISEAKAQELCNNFAEEVKDNVSAVPGYTIVNSDASCMQQQDEMAGRDYVPSVTIRVNADNIGTPELMQKSLDNLANGMPTTKYSVFIDNIPATDGNPAAICVNASKYIDNDGKDYPQGNEGNHAAYTEPGSIDGFAPCGSIQ